MRNVLNPDPEEPKIPEIEDGAESISPPTITIQEIADHLSLKPVTKTLPNGREVKTIVWEPTHLPEVYKYVAEHINEIAIGNNQPIIIDGAGPGWLITTISHACHPHPTAVSYPQGGPNAKLPLSGTTIEGEGKGENVTYTVTEEDAYTLVEFSIPAQIDAAETANSLVAPEVTPGKPVYISGRGPTALSTSLAEAYAHRTPFVANFQPGVGYVVSISHDDKTPLGTVIEEEK